MIIAIIAIRYLFLKNTQKTQKASKSRGIKKALKKHKKKNEKPFTGPTFHCADSNELKFVATKPTFLGFWGPRKAGSLGKNTKTTWGVGQSGCL